MRCIYRSSREMKSYRSDPTEESANCFEGNGYRDCTHSSPKKQLLDNQHFDREGHHAGHAQMILGLLYKAKKKRALAVQHLIEAKRNFCNSDKPHPRAGRRGARGIGAISSDIAHGSIAKRWGKLQVQPCLQCPVSDGRPEKGGLWLRADT